MATTEKYVIGSIATLMSTELNSLASSATAAAIAGTAFNNIQGGGGGDGYTLGDIELLVAAPGGAMTGSPLVSVWFLRDIDGTNYEDGGATVIPARPADVVIPLRAVSTAQRVTISGVKAPPGTWLALLNQQTGQSFAASGNTLRWLPYTPQGV